MLLKRYRNVLPFENKNKILYLLFCILLIYSYLCNLKFKP